MSIRRKRNSKKDAVDLLMLDDPDRPNSPRHPRESLNTDARISIPNIDVPVVSSPIVPANRKKRTIIKRERKKEITPRAGPSPALRPTPTVEKIPTGLKPSASKVSISNGPESVKTPAKSVKLPNRPTPLPATSKSQYDNVYVQSPGSAVPTRSRRNPERGYVPLPKKNGMPDYASLDAVQQAAKWAEFEVKFNILRENNPTFEITLPDRNHETLEEVHSRHMEYVKHITKTEFVDDCTEEYRAYLIIVWALIELFCSKLLLIPSSKGYFVFQLARFKKYEGLLVQLGEQGWNETKGKSASPLWSIIFSSIVTVVVFILVNFLTGSLGSGVTGEVTDTAVAFLLGERIENADGGLVDLIRQFTGGTGDLGSILDTLRGVAGAFGNNFTQVPA